MIPGDTMKLKSMIGPIFFSIVVGGLLAKFMFLQYDTKNVTLPVAKTKDSQTISFLQVGVYSTIDNMKKSLTNLENYIYVEEAGKYHVYIALSANEKNVEKLKGYYAEMGYVIYVKTIPVNDAEFLEELSKYDDLLSKTEDPKAIQVIISNVLNSYKELVINRNQN